jgi:hypothetical protein
MGYPLRENLREKYTAITGIIEGRLIRRFVLAGQTHDSRGALLSDHPHPHPVLRRITRGLVAAEIVADIAGVIGLLLLGVVYGLPLMPVIALFLAGMLIPLLQLAIMHPAITVYENGLWLQPMLTGGRWIPWEAVVVVADHTLIRRGTTKDRQREHFGQLIIVDDGLPRVYAVIGGLAGYGWRTRAFGISTHSHTDYKTLLNAIQKHKRR